MEKRSVLRTDKDTNKIFAMSVLNGWGLVADEVKVHAPVERLAGINP